MRKIKETRNVYKVQYYLNPEDYSRLEDICAKMNVPMSALCRDIMKEYLAK